MTKSDDIHIRLKLARKQKFRSAYQFALTNDIPPGTYINHENGNRGISVHTANRYAKLLGVNASWLLTGEGDMEHPGMSERTSLAYTTPRYEQPEKKHSLKSDRESMKAAMAIAKEIIERNYGSVSIEQITDLAFKMLEMAEEWKISENKINAEMAEWLLTWVD